MSRHQFLLRLVLVGVVIALANGEKSVPTGCTISQSGEELQCRGAGLTKIPEIPRGILIAYFTGNFIPLVTKKDLRHLEKLEEVYLAGNPFHCDCKLEHLRLKLLSNNSSFLQDGQSIRCSTPSQIENKALNSLSDLCDLIAEDESIQEGNATVCTNTSGLYVCNCKEGYHNTSDGCQDINECKTGTHKCDNTSSKCQNTNGGHYCLCLKGYHKSQDNCVDFDECKENRRICSDERAICKNTVGSYECACEEEGYKYSQEALHCLDIDECLKDPCDGNMACENSQGSYSCKCQPNFRKDGNVCKDVDECADENTQLCEGDMKCINLPGSFTCECDEGYLLDSYETCKDLDECKVRMHNCSRQSYCRNIPGSFKCECPKGYKGDGIKCSLTIWTRFTTLKHLLKGLKTGAWDTILVVVSAGVVAIALLVIIFQLLRKMCRKCCCKKKEFGYHDQVFFTEEVYDPDQMFFPEGEQMYYPDETGYPEGAENPDEMYYEPIPMETSDPSGAALPHTYYGDDQDDDLSDDDL